MSLTKRAISAVVVAVLLPLLSLQASYSTTALRCSNPTTLTGYEGTLSYPPYVVQQDVWQQVGSQTMSVCGPDDWKAVANQSGAPATGVKTYPDSQKTYTDWQHCSSQPPLSTFSKLSLSYREVAPAAGSYDWAVDAFLNNFCGVPLTEVMVLNQWRAVDFPTSKSVTIDHVPYLFYHSGSLIQFRLVSQNAAGTVNMLKVLHWCERKGLLPTTSTMQFLAYGAEVLTTSGVNVPFYLTGFSVTDG